MHSFAQIFFCKFLTFDNNFDYFFFQNTHTNRLEDGKFLLVLLFDCSFVLILTLYITEGVYSCCCCFSTSSMLLYCLTQSVISASRSNTDWLSRKLNVENSGSQYSNSLLSIANHTYVHRIGGPRMKSTRCQPQPGGEQKKFYCLSFWATNEKWEQQIIVYW